MATYKNNFGQDYEIGPGEIGYVKLPDSRYFQVSGDKSYSQVTDAATLQRLASGGKGYAEVPDIQSFLDTSIINRSAYNPQAIADFEAKQASGDLPGQNNTPTGASVRVKQYSKEDLQKLRDEGELLPGGTQQRDLEAAGLDRASQEAKKDKKKRGGSGGSSNISSDQYQVQPGESTDQYNARIAGLRGEGGQGGEQDPQTQAQSSIDVITDPVTGNSYYRDVSIPGSTYQPYNGQVTPAPSSSIAPPNQTYTDSQGSQPKSLEEIYATYGYAISGEGAEKFKLAPAASFKEVYSGILKATGYDSFLKEKKKLVDRIDDLDQELADKIADVNENPWLTEGVRVKEIQNLENRYDLKRAPHAANLELYNSLISDAQEEARYVATQSLNQYNQERAFQLDQIQMMQDQAEKLLQAELDLYEASQPAEKKYAAGSIGEYQFAVEQGYTGSYIDYQNEDANRKFRASGGSTPKLTEAERKSQALAEFQGAFVPGYRTPDGTPALDANGFVTPVAWKEAISEAKSRNIDRKDFITEFGYLLYLDPKKKTIDPAYGLTAQEQKLVTGS